MKKYLLPLLSLLAMAVITSCSDHKSYAEMLSDENKAVNLFLSQHRVVDQIPADSVFEIGPNAPYYCLDEDRNVYMQVIEKGDDQKPAVGDKVYVRYMRYDIATYVIGSDENVGTGNAFNMSSNSDYFVFGDLYLQPSAALGQGVQLPMLFLGYNCKVNLVVKSQGGAESDMSYVIPYL